MTIPDTDPWGTHGRTRPGVSEYFRDRADAMRGTAYLLCGDWHRAEDLVQTTFVKLYRAWRRAADPAAGHHALDAYTRKILVRTFLDDARRGWFRRESVTDTPTEHAAVAAGFGATEDRLALLTALRRVAPRQRAVLVLRYWADLSVEDTADAMHCSTGTVKSQSARGLNTLRAVLPAPTNHL